MGLLTDDQMNALGRGDLTNFNKNNRFDYDQNGDNILHYLTSIIRCKEISEAIEILGMSPHMFNHKFKSAIDIALEFDLPQQSESRWYQKSLEIDHAFLKRINDVKEDLLKQPLKVDDEFLDLILGGAVEHYTNTRIDSKRESIIGFFASKLCGVDIHSLLNQNRGEYNIKYIEHLQWFKGKSTEEISLEGFSSEIFLPIRIRSMLEIFVRLYCDENIEDVDFVLESIRTVSARTAIELKEEKLNTIKSEIKRDLQTYWIIRYSKKIIAHPSSYNDSLFQALAQGILGTIKELPVNEAVIIETGWKIKHFVKNDEGHSVYTRIKKIEGQKLEITVHNLGHGYPSWHKIDEAKKIETKEIWVYPYPVGVLNIEDEKNLYFYIKRVLEHVCPKQDFSRVQPIVYDKISPASSVKNILIGAMPLRLKANSALKEQTVGNCVVANHDAARKDLIEEHIYHWLYQMESAIPFKRNTDGYFKLDISVVSELEKKGLKPLSETKMYIKNMNLFSSFSQQLPFSVLIAQGDDAEKNNKITNALEIYSQALMFIHSGSIRDGERIYNLYSNLVSLHYKLGNYFKAAFFCSEMEKILLVKHDEMNSIIMSGILIYNVIIKNYRGLIKHAESCYGEAKLYYKEALLQCEKCFNSPTVLKSNIFNNMGLSCTHLGQYDEAMNYFKRAKELHIEYSSFSELPQYQIQLSIIRMNKANTLLCKKDYNGALKRYFKSIVTFGEFAPSSINLFYAYLGLVRVYDALGDYSNALNYIEKVRNKFNFKKAGYNLAAVSNNVSNPTIQWVNYDHWSKKIDHQYYENKLIFIKEIYGESHRESIAAMNELMINYLKKNMHFDARQLSLIIRDLLESSTLRSTIWGKNLKILHENLSCFG